jgi:hypothetical protein
MSRKGGHDATNIGAGSLAVDRSSLGPRICEDASIDIEAS